MNTFLKTIFSAAVVAAGTCCGQVSGLDIPLNTSGQIHQQTGQLQVSTGRQKFRILRDSWDSALKSRILFLQCDPPSQCLPFVVRVPGLPAPHPDPQQVQSAEAYTPRSILPRRKPIFRSGQKASLIWEEAGIRITIPVTCLDAGGVGERIRVRVAGPGGKILDAFVENASLLRGPA